MRVLLFVGLVATVGDAAAIAGHAVASDAPSALAERAPVTVKVSPRERFFVWAKLRDAKTENEADADAMARVWEGLDLRAVVKAVKDGGRAGKDIAQIEESFSETRATKQIARDDAGRLLKWLVAGDTAGALAVELAPLRLALRRGIEGAP